jgi:hypothetical protein
VGLGAIATLATGAGLTATVVVVVTGLQPGIDTVKLIVRVTGTEVVQLTLGGVGVLPGAGLQPSQFHVYVRPGALVAVIACATPLHAGLPVVIEIFGIAFTVTCALLVATGHPGTDDESVIVLTPAVDQLAVCAPALFPGAGLQPSQFQVYVAPETEVPCNVTLLPTHVGEG